MMPKMKAIAAILFLVCVGLGVMLYLRHKETTEVKKTVEERTLQITNLHRVLNDTRRNLDEQQQVTRELESTLTATRQSLAQASNRLLNTAADLAKTQKEKQAADEAAKLEIERRDAQIAQLAQQTNSLSVKMDELNASIDNLARSIAETERKLAAAEGDKDFLLKELKRLQAEKAELEKQFNDLKLLRTQIAKLRDELSVQKRLDWIRTGLYGSSSQKGAEKLLSAAAAATRTNYGLNVELRQDGTAVVAPTPEPATNAPPAPKPQ
jgi:chromosome segregation ATPase